MTKTATISELPQRPVNQLVGANVRFIMQLRDKTQVDLARLIHTTQSSMSRRIGGGTDWAPDELDAVAKYLNVQVGRFFEALPDLDPQTKDYGSHSSARITQLDDYRHPSPVHEHDAIITQLG